MRPPKSTGPRAPSRARGTPPRSARATFARVGSAVVVALLASPLTGCADDGPLGPEISADVAEFVTLVNEHRASVGCGPLAWRLDVAEVAQAHSDDMVARDFFAHTNPDGDSPFDRLSNAGITYSRAAENIAWGYSTPQRVLDAWLASPGHQANIENCSLTQHGVGMTDFHWTHLFVTP